VTDLPSPEAFALESQLLDHEVGRRQHLRLARGYCELVELEARKVFADELARGDTALDGLLRKAGAGAPMTHEESEELYARIRAVAPTRAQRRAARKHDP
jgi:hypothetical protein